MKDKIALRFAGRGIVLYNTSGKFIHLEKENGYCVGFEINYMFSYDMFGKYVDDYCYGIMYDPNSSDQHAQIK